MTAAKTQRQKEEQKHAICTAYLRAERCLSAVVGARYGATLGCRVHSDPHPSRRSRAPEP
jgi:hypothetical protein